MTTVSATALSSDSSHKAEETSGDLQNHFEQPPGSEAQNLPTQTEPTFSETAKARTIPATGSPVFEAHAVETVSAESAESSPPEATITIADPLAHFTVDILEREERRVKVADGASDKTTSIEVVESPTVAPQKADDAFSGHETAEPVATNSSDGNATVTEASETAAHDDHESSNSNTDSTRPSDLSLEDLTGRALPDSQEVEPPTGALSARTAREASTLEETQGIAITIPATSTGESFNEEYERASTPHDTTLDTTGQHHEPSKARSIPALGEDDQSKRKRHGSPKYQPPIRNPDVLTAPRQPRLPAVESRGRALSIEIHIHFGRRNRCQVALLPKRTDGLDETIAVHGPVGNETWVASQDEWYSDITPDGLGRILREGSRWETLHDAAVQWTLAAGRSIYVFAARPESGVFGFLTSPRLLLGEEHLVLCTAEMADAVRSALLDAGCQTPVSLNEDYGVPTGWLLFKNVRPTIALPHDASDGIINILRPVHDVEIELRGGIRIEHFKWLHGHPPQVRLRGDQMQVTIDQQVAICDEDGKYIVPGWNEPGVHRVFCGGKTASYELVRPPTVWPSFRASTYKTTNPPAFVLTICGPTVRKGDQSTMLLARTGRTWLVGPLPGQIVLAAPAFDLRAPSFLGAADFPVVWAVPTSPLQADKRTSTIQLLHRCAPEAIPVPLRANGAARFWASVIMDASYKRLRLEPTTDDARHLWAAYTLEARRIKKGSR